MSTRMSCRRIVVLTVLAVLACQPRLPAQTAAPLIASAQVSTDQTAVTIAGLHFGAAAPRVSLALTALTVTASTATQVTAALPGTVTPGTYLLALTRSDSAVAVFYLTIGAVGPAGPPGPAAGDGLGPRSNRVGQGALASVTTGRANSAFGYGTLRSATTGGRNVSVGSWALKTLTTGYRNTVVGAAAMTRNTIGRDNTALGAGALLGNLGSFNTAVGASALSRNTSGSGNVALGYAAGSDNTTGSGNVYVGHRGVNGESHTIRIGTPGTHTRTFLAGTVSAAAFAGDGSALTGVRAVYQ